VCSSKRLTSFSAALTLWSSSTRRSVCPTTRSSRPSKRSSSTPSPRLRREHLAHLLLGLLQSGLGDSHQPLVVGAL
jgi:hypothetical protein